MAGHNYSNKIRLAVLGDYIRTDLDENRSRPPQKNMWQDWSKELENASEVYSEKTARSQKLIDS